MSCCDTGRCVVEDPRERELLKEPECLMCDDSGYFYSISFARAFPCPCKEPQS